MPPPANPSDTIAPVSKPNPKSWSFWKNILLWALCLLLAAGYLLGAAVPKLTGEVWEVERFEAFGYSQGFRVLIGILEGVGALLLLWPRTASWGALVLAVVMIGATGTHIASGLGSAWHAARNLALLAVIAWGRWDKALRPRRSTPGR